MNARKMTALMQASSGGDRPILLHYSVKGGHSAGVSMTQLVDDYADEMAFLWNETAGQKPLQESNRRAPVPSFPPAPQMC
jgi:prolyl oligopeptidase